ncbi:nucleoside hydrolase [Paenibacillus tepidiphilus]|uniref:nucleoside hydrolase n=1 Tax=Paenibacillus tepidiphilus TaxID=2608683 RepID=UPI00123B969D|nr:nucleoside hydrolase [Paenibacillus tepidiphilus]
MSQRKMLLIDTDTAGDDCTALLLAACWPGVELKAVTTVAGNVPLSLGTRNALTTLEIAERPDVPVYPGAVKPLMRELFTAEHIHGSDGMGGSNFPEPSLQPQDEHAAQAIVRLINEYPGEIEMIAQAPLTNLALAYSLDPSIVGKLKRLWVMGGANNYIGNDSPAAEFNFFVDPEAANIVVHAGFNLTMMGWDVCHRSPVMAEEHFREIEAMNTAFASFYMKVLRTGMELGLKRTGQRRLSHPDTLTVAMAIDNRIMSRSGRYYIDVEYKSELTRGYSLVDMNGVLKKPPNAEVCLDADRELFREMVFTLLQQH